MLTPVPAGDALDPPLWEFNVPLVMLSLSLSLSLSL